MKREQQRHTPTPWRTQDKDNNTYPVSILAEDRIVAYVLEHFDDKSLARTNAEYITQCVNSHEKLIEGCKKALTCASLNSDVRALIVAALASAEAATATSDRLPCGCGRHDSCDRHAEEEADRRATGSTTGSDSDDNEEPTAAQLYQRV